MSLSPLILAIDTATPCSAVALTRGTTVDGSVLAALSLSGNVTHSRRLLAAVQSLLEKTGTDWQQLDGVCVTLGPGSFTGLRIGMATAKGLAAAAGKPLLGVSTLDGLAAKCVTDRLICSLLDARKKEVYVAFYRREWDGGCSRQGEVLVCPPEEVVGMIKEPVLLIGDGAAQYRRLFSEALGEKVQFAPAALDEPAAPILGMLGAERLLAGELLDIGSCSPLYVRSSDAELNLGQKKQRESAS